MGRGPHHLEETGMPWTGCRRQGVDVGTHSDPGKRAGPVPLCGDMGLCLKCPGSMSGRVDKNGHGLGSDGCSPSSKWPVLGDQQVEAVVT